MEVAQQFLDRRGDEPGVVRVAQQGELIGVFEEGGGTERDHVRGGLVARDQQEQGHLRGLSVRQLSGGDAPGDARQEVVLRVGEALGDLTGQISGDLPGRGAAFLGGRGRADHRPGVVLEHGVVVVGHAEQFADDQRGDRQRERLDEVGRVGTGQHVVDQAVHDPLYGGPEGLDLPDGERCRHHPAQPGVFGVVHHDEAELALAGLGTGLGRIAGLIGVGADPGIAQDGPLLGVAGHEPGLAAVPQAHLRERPLLLQFLEAGRRVEGTAGGARHGELGGGVRDVLCGTGHGFGHGSPRCGGGSARGAERRGEVVEASMSTCKQTGLTSSRQ